MSSKKPLGLRLDLDVFSRLQALAEVQGASPTAVATELLSRAILAAGDGAPTIEDTLTVVTQALDDLNRKQDELLAAFAAPRRAASRGAEETLQEFLDQDGAATENESDGLEE